MGLRMVSFDFNLVGVLLFICFFFTFFSLFLLSLVLRYSQLGSFNCKCEAGTR